MLKYSEGGIFALKDEIIDVHRNMEHLRNANDKQSEWCDEQEVRDLSQNEARACCFGDRNSQIMLIGGREAGNIAWRDCADWQCYIFED